MRVVSIAVLLLVFVGMPFMLLNYGVLPAIDGLQYQYSHIDETTQAIVNQK